MCWRSILTKHSRHLWKSLNLALMTIHCMYTTATCGNWSTHNSQLQISRINFPAVNGTHSISCRRRWWGTRDDDAAVLHRFRCARVALYFVFVPPFSFVLPQLWSRARVHHLSSSCPTQTPIGHSNSCVPWNSTVAEPLVAIPNTTYNSRKHAKT